MNKLTVPNGGVIIYSESAIEMEDKRLGACVQNF